MMYPVSQPPAGGTGVNYDIINEKYELKISDLMRHAGENVQACIMLSAVIAGPEQAP